MKYLCLIYDDESKRSTTPKEQLDTMMTEYGAFTEAIKRADNTSAATPYNPPRPPRQCGSARAKFPPPTAPSQRPRNNSEAST